MSLYKKLSTKYKIVSFDMDGTLIKGTTSNLFFAKLLNVEKEVIELEEKLKRGEINSEIFMIDVSLIMKNLTVEFINKHFLDLPIINGIHETVAYLKKADILPIIVTTSNILFAECFRNTFGFSEVFGTKHRICDDGRIGEGVLVCNSEMKIQHISSLAAKLNVGLEKVVAIGDSFSDIPIFSVAGKSIAFNYDDCLLGKADSYVRSNTIYSIFDYL